VSTESIITSVATTQTAGCSPRAAGVCQMIECFCGVVVARDAMGRKWERSGRRHPCRVAVGPIRLISGGR